MHMLEAVMEARLQFQESMACLASWRYPGVVLSGIFESCSVCPRVQCCMQANPDCGSVARLLTDVP